MGGVQAEKLKVIPEPVDTDFFNPATVKPYLLENAENLKYKFLSVFKVTLVCCTKLLTSLVGREKGLENFG